jgi:hypothetical protein
MTCVVFNEISNEGNYDIVIWEYMKYEKYYIEN